MCKYMIRRHGQLVGTYTDKNQALSDRLLGDKVFKIVETHGDYGCINEYPVNLLSEEEKEGEERRKN